MLAASLPTANSAGVTSFTFLSVVWGAENNRDQQLEGRLMVLCGTDTAQPAGKKEKHVLQNEQMPS